MQKPAYRTNAEIQQIKQALDRRGLSEPLSKICRAYNVTLEAALQRKRSSRLVHARDACIYRLLQVPMSTTEVGDLLGLDHTTVCAARKRYLERDNGRLLT